MTGYDSLYIEYLNAAKAPVTISNATLGVFAAVIVLLVLLL